jgi:hypothetical protein
MKLFTFIFSLLSIFIGYTGCGSSSSPTSDNEAPMLLDFRDRVVIPQDQNYTLRAYDLSKPVRFSLKNPPKDVKIVGDELIVPNVVGRSYQVELLAKDSVGNVLDKNITIFRVLPQVSSIPLEFKVMDKNNRYSWEESVKMCQQLGDGWSLPTIKQFADNDLRVYDMVKDIDSDLNSSNGYQGFISAIWSIEPADELNAGLRAKAWSYNSLTTKEIEDPIKGEEEERYFVLCVKRAN